MAKEKQQEEEKANVEARILGGLQSRLQHFRDNASSLTLAGIRRILEEDLGFEKYALDVHKSFIKQFVEKNLNDDDDYETKNSDSHAEKEVNSSVGEVTKSPEKEELGRTSPSDEAKKEEDSPIMGVLTPKTEMVNSQGIEISESMLKKAIWERADYIRSQSEKLTLAGARRFLEEDLKLTKNALDPFKKIIREHVEKVLDANDVSTSAMSAKSKSSGNRQIKAAKSTSSEGRSDSIDNEDDDEQHKMKSSGKTARRVEAKEFDRGKKRKRPEKKTDVAVKKQSELAKRHSEDSSADNERDVSEDDESQSAKKSVKKKEASTPTFGKHVEHLKSVIKACGMSIAPTVYKKAKQVPDSKREAFLIKELEDILAKEGLSKNPPEKEIKEVRKRKERAKELEGIDVSNIITSSRRRSAMSFLPPPKPPKKEKGRDNAVSTDEDKDAVDDGKKKEKKEQEKGSDNAVSTDKDKDAGNDDKKKEKQGGGGENDDDDVEEEEEGGDDSQSEEFNEDDEESE